MAAASFLPMSLLVFPMSLSRKIKRDLVRIKRDIISVNTGCAAIRPFLSEFLPRSASKKCPKTRLATALKRP